VYFLLLPVTVRSLNIKIAQADGEGGRQADVERMGSRDAAP
jgi:hypothetical protein